MSLEEKRYQSSSEPRAPDKLVDLRMQARYHRDRHRLYLARMGGSRPTSPTKLQALKRTRELAESRLSRAERSDQAE